MIISAFLIFGLWGLSVAARAPDLFGRLVATGLTILIVSGAFANIASMVGLIPLTGIPLIFISHGGSALLLALIECGIMLNIYRQSAVKSQV